MNLGQFIATKDSSGASSRKSEKQAAYPLNWDSLCAPLWHNWTSNVHSKGCRPWVETQPLSETYIQQVLTCPAEKSWQIPQLLYLWNDALIFILVFFLARPSSLFLLCFSSSVFLLLLFDVGDDGACFCCFLSDIVHSLSLSLNYLTRWEQSLALFR